MAAQDGPLYLGLDLSTQQLKGIIIASDLKVEYEARVDFDVDLSKYGIKKGVLVNEGEGGVYAPVAMWLEAIDLLFQRLKNEGMPFERIKGISGAGQQHGSIYWNLAGEHALGNLNPARGLANQLQEAFAYPFSPNWQDASTQKECDAFDAELGSEDALADNTGNKAHHRFTGPQIMRLRKLRPDIYNMTSRITLVSSFLASLFVGSIAPIDISDVCGVNLWDIKAAKWNEVLLRLTAGDSGSVSLKQKLGDVNDQQLCIGPISNYFVQRFGFNANCAIVPFTGDNPSTILALPLRPLDVMVSLGTSTTLLMSTPKYVPDPAYHFFNHPTSKGLYMFMLCYKNGGLAREGIRNALPCASNEDSWSNFNRRILSTPPLGQPKSSSPIKLGLYFPLPEIVPNVRAGTWRYSCSGDGLHLQETTPPWSIEDDARAIVESQILSLRLRSRNLVESPEVGFPPQPRRIYLVGGGSFNPAIAQVVGEVLGGTEGVWRLGVGGNACALGGAYKALWSVEKKETQSFDDLIRERWKEDKNVKKVDRGYRKEIWEKYGNVLGVFEEMERRVLAQENKTCKSLT